MTATSRAKGVKGIVPFPFIEPECQWLEGDAANDNQ
jgi:hypothetical protein